MRMRLGATVHSIELGVTVRSAWGSSRAFYDASHAGEISNTAVLVRPIKERIAPA
jgi:hypothetical protein